ncbi:MAG: 5-(carboxyamino)imidazole ribonucleotide synthase [Bacteroidetes bacterium]|nr:5-(carboxyamino)imidazole ribonucleotide synthase [Bacteroidota bacterium]
MKKPFHPIIGIIGGGQLGKMLIESGMPCNIQYNVLDPDPNAPCRKYALNFINASLENKNAIKKLSSVSNILTYEIEHVNTDALEELERNGVKVIPSSSILKIIKDKGLQKNFYTQNNLPTAFYKIVKSHDDWINAIDDFKGEKIIAKLCSGGYDGRGVALCNKTDIKNGKIPFEQPCIIEEFVNDITELSVIVASDGTKSVSWNTIFMHFDPKLNLVDYLYSPGDIESDIEEKVTEIAKNAIKCLNGKGVFAVEMFLTKENKIFINEIAPRPHNSGHHTIEASYTSQYEQLNRILLDLPLGNTSLIKPSAMVNIIGPENINGDYQIEGLDFALKQKGFYLHLYNKIQTRPGRKLGHFTILADTTKEAIEIALKIKKKLKILEKK